jgi:zinc protease
VEKLSLEDVRTRYRALVRPENMTLLIAGDLTPGEAKSTLDRLFGDWKTEGKADSKAREVSAPSRDALQVVLVHRPDAVQTVVHFMMPGPHYADPARVTYRLVNTILGGSFTSRLNMNLREEHGYTYGARSRFAMLPRLGYVTAWSSVRADVTGESLKEFLKELNAIRGGTITDNEAQKSSETLRTDVIQSFAGLGGILSEAAERLIGGLPFESLEGDMAAMQSANAASLNRLAKIAIPYDRGVLVLVGDRDSILAQMEGLDLPRPIERTVRGDRAGS